MIELEGKEGKREVAEEWKLDKKKVRKWSERENVKRRGAGRKEEEKITRKNKREGRKATGARGMTVREKERWKKR